MSRRRCFDSNSNTRSEQGEMPSAAAPLEDDDLLSEILLLLPPLPCSLPRASLVCRRWRRLVSDPGFVRRFHTHHSSKAPLLGFFGHALRDVSFLPALDAPNRVPSGLLSRKMDCSHYFWALDCRHGLVLVFLRGHNQVTVWDSVSDDQHHIAVPLGFCMGAISGAVVRAAGPVQHFQVVLVGRDKKRRGTACAFSSKTGVWGNLISMPKLPSDYAGPPTMVRELPSVLVGNSLYWLLSERILRFDLDRQALTMINLPPLSFHDRHNNTHFRVMRAEDGGLGFLFLSDLTAELWRRKTDFDGVASWMLERTIELDKVLSPSLAKEVKYLWMLGLAENNNVLLLMADGRLFMVQLQSLHLEQLDGYKIQQYLPFESVYTSSNSWRV